MFNVESRDSGIALEKRRIRWLNCGADYIRKMFMNLSPLLMKEMGITWQGSGRIQIQRTDPDCLDNFNI